jgi:hypothetical protein
MHVAFERSWVTRRTLTALALAGTAALTAALTPLCAQRQDTVPPGPVQRATVVFTRIDSAVRAAGVRVDSAAMLRSESGCQMVRATVLGMAAYQGYRAGSVTGLTVHSWHASQAFVAGAEAVGAAASVIWAMYEPLPRPLPLCPSDLRTISGHRPSRTIGCRASQLGEAMLGLHTGSIAAVVLAPVVTVAEFVGGRSKEDRRTHRRVILVALPVAGAAVGALDAQRRPPCAAARARRES